MTQVQALVEAYDTFITGCKSDGTWDAIKASCIMAGWDGLSGALTPLKGTAPTNINFSGAADPYWNSVSLLLRGEGADNSTTFTDSSPSPLTPTVIASSVLDILASAGKFGSGIKYTDTGITNAYIRYNNPTALQFGTGDFTWECWIRPDQAPAAGLFNVLWDSRASGDALTNRFYVDFYPNGDSTLRCFANGTLIQSTTNLSIGAWYHVAICKASGTTRLFVNGVEEASTPDSANYTNGTNRPILFNNLLVNQRGKGFSLDELRVTKGVARYTSNFTPPSTAFPGSLQSDYNRTTGLVGNGSTKYLDTNRAGNADPQNNAHLAVQVTAIASGSPAGAPYYISSGAASTGAKGIFRALVSPDLLQHGVLPTSSTVTAAGNNTPASGFVGYSRTGSSAFTFRNEGVNTPGVTASQTPTSDNTFIFARNNGSNVAERYTNARLSFYSTGESLDLALLDSRVTQLMADIAAAIP